MADTTVAEGAPATQRRRGGGAAGAQGNDGTQDANAAANTNAGGRGRGRGRGRGGRRGGYGQRAGPTAIAAGEAAADAAAAAAAPAPAAGGADAGADAGAAPAGNRPRGRGRGGRGRGRGAAAGAAAGAGGAPLRQRPRRILGDAVANEVFVRNIPRALTKEAIAEIARSFGNTVRLRVLRQAGRVNAHIGYESPEVANAAVTALEGKEVEGRQLHAAIYRRLVRDPNAPPPVAAPAPAAADAGAPAAGGAAAGGAAGRPRRQRQRKPAPAEGANAAAGGASGEGAAAAAPRRPRAELVADPTSVWVGNVHAETSDQEVTTTFGRFGTVLEIFFGSNFAYVKFDTAEHADAAIAGLNNTELHGSVVKVEHARPRRVPRPVNQNPLKLYVGNLPAGYDANALSTAFVGVVSIESRDGFAYIIVDTQENANVNLAKDKTALLGSEAIGVAVARR